MGSVEIAALGIVGLVVVVGLVAAAGLVAALVARDRRRRNHVVPGTDTGAPLAWAGAHTPEARLHRRLRDAVRGLRMIPDPDGGLLAARTEVERAAIAVDRQLVALAALPERLTSGAMADATAAVAAIESAVTSVAGAARGAEPGIAGRGPGRLAAVEEASERARLLAEARAELDEVDATSGRDWSADRPPRGAVTVVDGTDDAAARSDHAPGDDEEPDTGRAMPG